MVATICTSASVTPQVTRRDKQAKARRSSAETRSLASSERKRSPISGAVPGFFATLWRQSQESRNTRDWLAGAPGFEPGITGPKPVALPLGHAPIASEICPASHAFCPGAGVRSLYMVSGRPPISIVPPGQRMAEWPPEEPHKEIAKSFVQSC